MPKSTVTLSTSLEQNKEAFNRLLPLSDSFDFITRDLALGDTPCFFMGLNGLCDLDVILRIFSEIKASDFSALAGSPCRNLPEIIQDQFLYAQVSFSSSIDKLANALLSGPCVLLLEGYGQGLIIDTREYPLRSVEEPDSEKVIRGAKDGFVETLLINCNLIRRRLRSPKLTFALQNVGDLSHTDVVLAYLKDNCDPTLLKEVKKKLSSLDTSSLTMGIQSLQELLVKKSFFHPMPCFFLTARPDVACSYLAEGYILLLCDNSPFALVLPCNLFQFTQSPDDYYKSPLVGTWLRLVRLACILISLFLMPLFLLFAGHPGWLPPALSPLVPADTTPFALFIYVLFVELGLDLFKYASAHTASGYSGAFAIVGGLLIGDTAIGLNWANEEVIFYGAATLLATLGLVSVELGDALRLYRLFLILLTGLFSGPGFLIGLFLTLASIITTPVFGKKSYFWPLFPFHWKALRTLLFRYPTFMAQPEDKNQP
ncbi:MAG: spore germination protein [Lachnospiraceae bacterium]|nr:spore germination protein [Lachnospiraceae bacterium]